MTSNELNKSASEVMADMFLSNEAGKFHTPENNANKIFSIEFDINHDCPETDKQLIDLGRNNAFEGCNTKGLSDSDSDFMPDNNYIETNSKDKDIVTMQSNSKGISMNNQKSFKKISTPTPISCEEKSNNFFHVNQSNNDTVNEHFDDRVSVIRRVKRHQGKRMKSKV